MSPLLFESIRLLDGQAELLSYHQTRAERSCGRRLPPLAELLAPLAAAQPQGEYKLHLPYNAAGWQLRALRAEPYRLRQLRRLLVVESPLRYPVKSEDRRGLDALRRLAQEQHGADDVIICHGGRITDSSYSNLLFREGEQWISPQDYLLPGCRRAALLAEGRVQLRPVLREEVRAGRYDAVCLINAMMPLGRLVLPSSALLFGGECGDSATK